MSDTTFRILDASHPEDFAAWMALWQGWPDHEVFAHPAYVQLFAGDGDRALCAAMESASGNVLYPFIRRPIAGGDSCDITSAYGYGGAFVTTPAAATLAPEFYGAFDAWAREARVVSEFIRFALFESELLPYAGEREKRQDNIVRTLAIDEPAMWMEFEHKVRKNVQKAQRSGITIEFDPDGARLSDFLRIYYGTMDRRDAAAGYHFPESFFRAFLTDLAGNAVFVHAIMNEVVVSTELVLLSARSCYSFLGGTNESAFAARPNDALKFETIKCAKARGLSQYVLGGGASPDDGIFRYKRAFAPHGVVPFHIGKRILDPAAYDALVLRRQSHTGDELAAPPGFFPAYRAP